MQDYMIFIVGTYDGEPMEYQPDLSTVSVLVKDNPRIWKSLTVYKMSVLGRSYNVAGEFQPTYPEVEKALSMYQVKPTD